MTTKQEIWESFCRAHCIAEKGVPLFAHDAAGIVETFKYGRDERAMLRRSPAMRSLVVSTVRSLLARPSSEAEGLLYMMYRSDGKGTVVPLYIGKAGRHGRSGAEVSANLLNIDRDEDKFARWGYNYKYHFGDLSAAVLPGHAEPKLSPKYARWAKALFQNAPTPNPVLRTDTRFWCTSWGPASVTIWQEFSPSSLAFTEYLLIGVASLLFPNDLLNSEGVNQPAI
jgi:hypothetical protein